MKIGIFAKTFTVGPRSGSSVLDAVPKEQALVPTVQELFQLISGHGIRCVQFNLSCAGLDTLPSRKPSAELLREIITMAEQTKVELSAISGTFNMAHPDPGTRQDNLQKFEFLCEAAARLRIPVITLCIGTRDLSDMWKWHPENDSQAAWDDMVRSIESSLVMAEKFGLILAFEPERENIVNSAKRARKLLDDLANPRLRIIIDPANLIFPGCHQEEILDDTFAQLSDAITIAHAKDRDRHFSPCAPGKGILDFPYYVRCLKQSGFTGPLIMHGLEEYEVPSSRQFLAGLIG